MLYVLQIFLGGHSPDQDTVLSNPEDLYYLDWMCDITHLDINMFKQDLY